MQFSDRFPNHLPIRPARLRFAAILLSLAILCGLAAIIVRLAL
jgi:hypothetical protein